MLNKAQSQIYLREGKKTGGSDSGSWKPEPRAESESVGVGVGVGGLSRSPSYFSKSALESNVLAFSILVLRCLNFART